MSYLNPYLDDQEAYTEDWYVVRHWRGQLTLPVSYWINGGLLFTVTNVVINILLEVIGNSSSSLQLISAAVVGGLILILAIRVWSLVGIWRSAGRHVARGGSAFWAGMARFMVVLGAFTAAAQTYAAYHGLAEYAQIAMGRDPIGNPANFSLSAAGDTMTVTGNLVEGSSQHFGSALEKAPALRKIVLTSDGGRIFEAEAMGALVKKRGLDTHVEGSCQSACTVVFLAGLKRTVGAGSALGFHSAWFPGWSDQEQSLANAALRRVYDEAGLRRSFVQRAVATPPESMWIPSVSELRAANVVTDTKENLGALLGQAVAESKSGLPKRLDDITTFQSITAEADTLVFNYRVNLPREDIDREAFKAGLTPPLHANSCSTPAREVVDLGGSLDYRYRDVRGRKIDSILITGCPLRPDQRAS